MKIVKTYLGKLPFPSRNIEFITGLILVGILFFLSSIAHAEYWVDFKRVDGKEAIVIEYDTGLKQIYFIKDETWKSKDVDKISKEVCLGLRLKNCENN
jgi:hypothetical protein